MEEDIILVRKHLIYQTNDLLNSQFGENVNKNYQNTIQHQIRFINSDKFNLLEEIENSLDKRQSHNNLRPSKVILTSPVWSNIIYKTKNFEKKLFQDTCRDIKLKNFALNFKKRITDNKSENSLKYLTAFLVFIDFILNRDFLNSSSYKQKEVELDFYDNLAKHLEKNQYSRIEEVYYLIE